MATTMPAPPIADVLELMLLLRQMLYGYINGRYSITEFAETRLGGQIPILENGPIMLSLFMTDRFITC